MTAVGFLWQFTYDQNGMRTSRTNGTRVYNYVYNGSSLSQVTVDNHDLNFTYDTSGSPMSLIYDGTAYWYDLNLQGDVVGILDSNGNTVVRYTYNAWGCILSITGSEKDTVGFYNPLRYRGYVWDPETGLYYLQSRYYAPGLGRFINADALVSTGQGLLGNNMFAYCGNNPVNYIDSHGQEPITISVTVAALAVTAVIMLGGLLIYITVNALSTFIDWLSCQWYIPFARIEYASTESTTPPNEKKGETKEDKRSLDVEGPSNSDAELYDNEGNLKQKRHYGPDGKAEYDIDYKHSGNFDFPHTHTWDWNVVPPRSGHLPLLK